MKSKEKELLIHNLSLLQKSLESFEASISKCRKIGIKDKYSFEELESFDSLTSKFARTSDIYTQKVLRTLLIILREPQKTFIDMANKAGSLDLVVSAEILLEIRDLRNDIAHEYLEVELYQLFKDVLEISNALIESIHKTIKYTEEKILD